MTNHLDRDARRLLRRYGSVEEVMASCHACGAALVLEVAGTLLVPQAQVRDLTAEGFGLVHVGCGGEVTLHRSAG